MLKRINIKPVMHRHKKKVTLDLLDGDNFDSMADHIIALREVGIYVQPQSSQHPSELIISVQEKLNKEIGFEKSCIQIIKNVLGKKLLRQASKLAKLRGEYMDDYVEEFREAIRDGVVSNLRFLDKENRQYGLIAKRKWETAPLIDPIRLEPHFNLLFRDKFTAREAAAFGNAFAKYKEDYAGELDAGKDIGARDVCDALENYDFYSELFDLESRSGGAAARKFEKMIMKMVYSPFTECCSFLISSDK